MMQRIKAAFEVLKAPWFRTSAITATGCKHGPNLWQEHHHKAKDAQRGCSKGKRQCTSMWDRWQRDETYRESQVVHEWSDAWVRYFGHVANIDISHTAPHSQRQRYNNVLYLRSVNEDKQAPPLPQRPGYKDAKKHWLMCRSKWDKNAELLLSQKFARQRLHNQLDPSMQRYLERLSTDWAEYFAEERPPPTWTPSSSWWASSSWTSDWHQHEWKDRT